MILMEAVPSFLTAFSVSGTRSPVSSVSASSAGWLTWVTCVAGVVISAVSAGTYCVTAMTFIWSPSATAPSVIAYDRWKSSVWSSVLSS